MDNRDQTVIGYAGQILNLVNMLNEKFPSFTAIYSFQILMDDASYLQGATVSEFADGNDLSDLMVLVQEAYSKKNPDGIEFEMDLARLINDLSDELDGEPGGDK